MVGGNKIRLSARPGLTLLEVMVAFTILLIAGLALMPMAAYIMKTNLYNKRVAQARLLMQQYAEQFRSLDFGDPLISDDGDTTDLWDTLSYDHTDSVTVEGTLYVLGWNVVNDSPTSGVKTINIFVEWHDPAIEMRKKRVNLLTYKTSAPR